MCCKEVTDKNVFDSDKMDLRTNNDFIYPKLSAIYPQFIQEKSEQSNEMC